MDSEPIMHKDQNYWVPQNNDGRIDYTLPGQASGYGVPGMRVNNRPLPGDSGPILLSLGGAPCQSSGNDLWMTMSIATALELLTMLSATVLDALAAEGVPIEPLQFRDITLDRRCRCGACEPREGR